MVPKLTTKGIDLMVRAMAGEGIIFTKIAIGNGTAPSDYKELTTLQNEMVGMGIEEIITEDQYVIVKAKMTNADFDTGFYWTELGVFAEDPDGGEDVLYAYAHYEISEDEAATYIPASNSSLVEITHSVHVFVGELENVTAMLTKHSEFASAADLEDHKDNNENPHNVTKAQVGLSLIVNAKPEDQKPIFSTKESSYTVSTKTGMYTFSNIFSGENVGSILQKLRTIIALTIGHFNATNPHRLTASGVGAAEKSHQHSANDVNSGTLGIARGGTGGSTPAKARFNLGIQAGLGSIQGKKGVECIRDIYFNTAFETVPYVVVTPITEMYSGDVWLCVNEVQEDHFTVWIYSDTLNPIINFNWIACL